MYNIDYFVRGMVDPSIACSCMLAGRHRSAINTPHWCARTAVCAALPMDRA